eukprot:gene987-1314_t
MPGSKDQLLTELSALKQRIAEIEHELHQQDKHAGLTGDTNALQLSGPGAAGVSDDKAQAVGHEQQTEAAQADTPAQVPMDASRIVMHQIVGPAEVDVLGICFGGQVLSWIDLCAGLSAKTLARGPCVTVSVDAVHFFRPCCRGDVVIIAAMVNRTFASSIEVGVRVEAENMRTVAPPRMDGGFVTPPRMDGGLTTPPRMRIYSQAETRRQERLLARVAAKADPEAAAAAAACRLKPITHR